MDTEAAQSRGAVPARTTQHSELLGTDQNEKCKQGAEEGEDKGDDSGKSTHLKGTWPMKGKKKTDKPL